MLKEGTKGKEREKKRRRKRERNRKDKGKHQAERFVMPESEREEWEEGAPVTSMGGSHRELQGMLMSPLCSTEITQAQPQDSSHRVSDSPAGVCSSSATACTVSVIDLEGNFPMVGMLPCLGDGKRAADSFYGKDGNPPFFCLPSCSTFLSPCILLCPVNPWWNRSGADIYILPVTIGRFSLGESC